jgi:hypothetical protein
MLRIKPLLVLCAALLTFTPAASADVNSDMNQFFNKLGFASNTTQPGVWQDALLVVERQMSYMRQQLSARMLSRYQNNYHFGGNSL